MTAPVSLNYCAVMPQWWDSPRRLEIRKRSPAERRRRNLRRAIDRWYADTNAWIPTVRKVRLVALTFRDSDPMAARGAIREFWEHFRRTFGRTPYFSWAELQMRGAVHYHAMIVNDRWKRERDARRWIQKHWPHADIQPSVQLRDGAWWQRSAGGYVKKYAVDPSKREAVELGEGPPINRLRPVDKSYQQQYEQLPREIRTFQHNLLEHYMSAVDQHVDRPIIVNTAPPMAPWTVRALNFWLAGVERHTVARWGCSLVLTKKRRSSGCRGRTSARRNTGDASTHIPRR